MAPILHEMRRRWLHCKELFSTCRPVVTARGKAIDVLGRFAWHDKAQFDQHRNLVDRVFEEKGPDRLLAATGLFIQAAIKHNLSDAVTPNVVGFAAEVSA